MRQTIILMVVLALLVFAAGCARRYTPVGQDTTSGDTSALDSEMSDIDKSMSDIDSIDAELNTADMDSLESELKDIDW